MISISIMITINNIDIDIIHQVLIEITSLMFLDDKFLLTNKL